VADSAHLEAQVEGTLDHVLFVNDQNGYAVAVIALDTPRNGTKTLTIKGPLAGIEIGSNIRARGRFEKHQQYGEQFVVEDFETLRPAGVFALERYLQSEIHGVGPATARKIVEHFGDDLREILDTTPERVSEVPGLRKTVASRIVAAWKDSSGLRELTVFLRGHGIAAAHARRIHKRYGKHSLEVVKRDPYVLARTIHGIGFRTADMVAEKLGIPKNSIERARAAILFLLERMADEGHIYTPREYLEGQFQSGLEMDLDLVPRALDELTAAGEVVVEDADEHVAVYLARLHAAEVNVAKRLRALTVGRPMSPQVAERALKQAAAAGGITLSNEQMRALQTALSSAVTVITGGPGTGKTTILRSLLVALADAGLRPTLAAPTGRAARRLHDATDRDARTIHRLLEYSPETGGFVRDQNFPLRTNYLIVDEASMMDIELASSLLSALVPNCSLVLVGDRDQLPSVGPGSVLKDVIASDLVPVVQLREVYRQARESRIVANAHGLNRGYFPDISNHPEGDFFFFERAAPEDVLATIKQLVRERLIGRFGIRGPADIQVLTPMNRGPLGAHALNRELQQLLNPAGRGMRAGEREIREGDRVIQLRNDYEKAIFNGSIGRVLSIDTEKGRVTVAFEDGHSDYDQSELDELGLGYAISVHKSQGSQYPAVIVPVHPSHYLMLRRNLLYTAITRAERVCVLVGTKAALQQAVRNQDERRRASRLAERLRID
jgi:exodeoxyribonuclease V alpha subunit